MMTILEVINQIELEFWRDSDADGSFANKAALHELAWQLVNLTRPEENEDDR